MADIDTEISRKLFKNRDIRIPKLLTRIGIYKRRHSKREIEYADWVLSQMTDVPDNRRPRWPKIRAIDTTGYIHLSRFYLSLLQNWD